MDKPVTTTSAPREAVSPLTARALDVAETAGDLVSFVAAVPFPSAPVPIDGYGQTDWVVFDAKLDPHVTSGQLSVPRDARRRLEQVAATGVEFDALLIAHELPAGTVAKLNDSQVHSRTCHTPGGGDQNAAAKLDTMLGAPPADRTAVRVVALANKAVDGLRHAAVGAGRAAVHTGAAVHQGLDPAILGAVAADSPPKPGELCAVFYLVHWT